MEAAGVDLQELPDWNCCGATSYMSVDERAAVQLALRNLALAEKSRDDGGPVNLVAPCAACYLVLQKAQHRIADYPDYAAVAKQDLARVDLTYEGRVKVRHPLDVLVNDVGLDRIRRLVQHPLRDLKVACYYGCQLVRPYSEFDDRDDPKTMDLLMEAVGATVVDWPLKTRCCGGMLPGTIREVGVRLNELLVEEAARRGATVLATACPLCQFNLDTQQKRRPEGYKPVPPVFFTQLVGLAFGIPRRRLGLHRQMVAFEHDFAGSTGGSRG